MKKLPLLIPGFSDFLNQHQAAIRFIIVKSFHFEYLPKNPTLIIK